MNKDIQITVTSIYDFLARSRPAQTRKTLFFVIALITGCSDSSSNPIAGTNPPETPEVISTPDGNSPTAENNSNPAISPATIEAEDIAAARLLTQATFGTTIEDINRVKALGIEQWIDDQFTQPGSSHLAYALNNGGSSSNAEARVNKWWLDAIDSEDQLRGRVAFALSQIFVVSDVQQTLGNAQLGLADYYDMLRDNAFGNYRDLLEDVTLSPVMGVYLSMLQNARANPASNTRADENFAREVMQLFSIGLHELNLDGTPKLANGRQIATYTQDDIAEYARVYTGWAYANTDRWDAQPLSQYADFLNPMVPYPQYHDTGEKRLLDGVVSPAGLTAEEDLRIALDSLFNHPSVGPFFVKQLIQRLVTSNPTAGYVERIARIFNNNGEGVRGDLQAVVRAILLDDEARNGHSTNANFGKLREPLLRMTHLWRAFDAQFADGRNNYTSNAPQLKNIASSFGQSALNAASVFNFFHPDYAPLGAIRDAGLVAPESEIYSENYVLSTNTFISTYIHKFYYAGTEAGGVQFLTYINIEPQTRTAANPEDLLDELNLVLMSGQMPDDMRNILMQHLDALPNDIRGRAQRVKDSISLIMTQPAYLVQK